MRGLGRRGGGGGGSDGAVNERSLSINPSRNATNYGEHVPVDMTSRPCACAKRLPLPGVMTATAPWPPARTPCPSHMPHEAVKTPAG